MIIKCRFCKKDLLQESTRQRYHPQCTSINRPKVNRLPTIRLGECQICHITFTRTGNNSKFCKDCVKERAAIQRREWHKNHPKLTKSQLVKREQQKLRELASKITKIPETVRMYS